MRSNQPLRTESSRRRRDGGLMQTCDDPTTNLVKASPQLRVLVVDDEPLIRWSLAQTLEQSGHSVAEAGDAESAIRSVSAGEEFDVVLLDYRLPDSNDLKLLASIRKLAPATAVIMMTAFGTPEMMTRAIMLGVYQVIPKPFEVDEVAALVLEAHAAPRQGPESAVRSRKSIAVAGECSSN